VPSDSCIRPDAQGVRWPWHQPAARTWARWCWRRLRPDPKEDLFGADLTHAAVRLLALASLYADFDQLVCDSFWGFDLEQAAGALGVSHSLVGALAANECDVEEVLLEHEGFTEGREAEGVFLEILVRARRLGVVEELRSALGGARMLYVSLDSLGRRLGTIGGSLWCGEDEPERPDPTQMQWDLIPVYVELHWPTAGQGNGYLPTRMEMMSIDAEDRLASWVHAGCPWLGPRWDE